MNIQAPRLPDPLKMIDDFAAYARPLIADDATIAEIKIENGQEEQADFYKMDIRTSTFSNCTYHKCCFEKASFIDVVFQSCDFSNSNFEGAYFERCRFISCKCVGTEMIGVFCKQVTFQESNLQYANLNTVKLAGVRFSHVDFSDASMADAKLSRFFTEGSKFIRSDFSKTMLAGVDFTGNLLAGPIVSSPPHELRGIVVDMFQAASLAGLLGIKIKQQE